MNEHADIPASGRGSRPDLCRWMQPVLRWNEANALTCEMKAFKASVPAWIRRGKLTPAQAMQRIADCQRAIDAAQEGKR